MHVLSVVGRDSAARGVADRLATRLCETGRVAEVHRTETNVEPHDEPADAAYELDPEGWTATGRDRSLDDLLADLAPDYDYALLVGFPEADAPRVVVGDADDWTADDAESEEPGETLVVADTPADVDPDEVRDRLADTEPYETLESLVADVKRSDDAPYSGAIATFTGRVRAKEDEDDEPTQFLEFEKYEGVAEERMDAISTELEEREGVFDVVMHHRTGVIEYGEDIVFVVVLAGHREDAFRTVEDGIDRLKDEVPIFKKEVTTDEQFWVHEQS
ncbi:molybdopterin synthase [Halorussus gelatinilyticus]|uniref:Molybdopterin synthase n=1 Tax=Halorussus gelatinilyticus TaxID=2937524 RepID=A0A8U0IL57_9EURY|nr:molybdopterin synthase [Halorussus gelatinilyticus]UPW01351.1 molybdopterin synthase [Halorussus gelatinilyticus]